MAFGMNKSIEAENKLPNIIGSGTKVVGDIETSGDLRADGVIEGNVIVKGKFVLGQSGSVKGTIKCGSGEISGRFEGKAEVAEILSLKSTAVFDGEMIVNKLSIEPGAKFTGNCSMSVPAAKPAAADVKK